MYRNRLIAAIHKTCRVKDIDKDLRHELQKTRFGKTSLTDFTDAELGQFLTQLNDNKPADLDKAEWKFVFKLPDDRRLLGQKIYRLCESIGGFQTPPRSVMPKAWVEGIARQMKGLFNQEQVEVRLELCDAAQLRKIIAALEIHKRRRGR
ncbi:MAG: DUF1018 domain-containing protein [Candidatus Pacebacteria bacterium]|nr:DUF1018 domain-containing protein [Candidatus Paceibacterota bacterium]